MKNATMVALVLGLLIAMMPAAMAFHAVNKLPAYGEPKKENAVKGGVPQYWTARADIQYRASHYGTKYGGPSLRKSIKFERQPVGYRAAYQKGLKMQQGASAVKTVDVVSGMPGESDSTTK